MVMTKIENTFNLTQLSVVSSGETIHYFYTFITKTKNGVKINYNYETCN